MDKLPADLPENWTQGQTISPNGTEVGLTEQHGYNYLNKQVNAVQRAVNDIHTELDGSAKETTVNEINAKIGESEDSSTKPTIFGKLAELKQIILEKASDIISAVTGFVDKIGNPEDSSSTDTVFGRLANVQDIVTKVGKYGDSTSASTLFGQIAKVYNKIPSSSSSSSCIRRVQRGVFTLSSTNSIVTVSLSGFSNSNKMMAILDGYGAYSTSGSSYAEVYMRVPYCSQLSTSSLNISGAGNNDDNVSIIGSYQVVEFY